MLMQFLDIQVFDYNKLKCKAYNFLFLNNLSGAASGSNLSKGKAHIRMDVVLPRKIKRPRSGKGSGTDPGLGDGWEGEDEGGDWGGEDGEQ